MFKKTLLTTVLSLMIVSFAFAQQLQRIERKDGGTITGVVRETEDGYEIRTESGVIIEIAKDEVASIKDVKTPRDEYRERLAKIDPESAKDRLDLGQWAYDEGLLSIAVRELAKAVELDPTNRRASVLLSQAKAKLEAQRGGRTTPPERDQTPAARDRIRSEEMITKTEMNRMRLAEIKRDERIRVRFKDDVIDRFVDSMKTSKDFRENPDFEDRFRRLSKNRQLQYMLDNIGESNWEIRDDIIVLEDPRVFETFRTRIWPMVAENCASGNCHGASSGAGRFKLYNVSRSNDLGMYTNFLILDEYRGAGRKMFYRDHAEDSLLLEYGLAREQSRIKHPTEIREIFRDLNDRSYRMTLDWLESLAGPPHPDYGTSYTPPFGSSREVADPLDLPEDEQEKTTRPDRRKDQDDRDREEDEEQPDDSDEDEEQPEDSGEIRPI